MISHLQDRAYQDSDQSVARLGHIKTPINHLQDIGMSILRSINRKTWAYQDTNKLSQVIGISVLRLIILKTWAYQDTFTRLGCIRTLINHLQDLGLSRFRSIIRTTLAYQDSDQLFARLVHIKTLINHLQDLGISEHTPIMVYWNKANGR